MRVLSTTRGKNRAGEGIVSEQTPWHPYGQQQVQPPNQDQPYRGQPPFQRQQFPSKPYQGEPPHPGPGYGPQPPPRRKRHMVRNILVGLGAVIVAGIVINALSSRSGGVSTTAVGSSSTAGSASSPAATQQAPARASVQAPATSRMTAVQSAAMRSWYSGATVSQVANVCGDVNRLYLDNVAVNSGSGSSSLETDITTLQADIATALANPPPVAADAVIWKRVLTAYSNAAGGPDNSGLVAAVRSAKNAAWNWTPPVGGTLLVCLNVSI
jgi:hypothetical protein